jgi:hypothetical protein
MSIAALPLLRRTRGVGSGSFQKKKILKTREFIQNLHFKERYTVELDEFQRLEAIALV